jgi:O-antigen/teichoic acid export membrane protein
VSRAAEFFRSGFKLFPNTIGTYLLLSNGVLVGGFFLSPTEIGWYQLGMQVVALIALIPQSFGTVMFARLAGSTPDGIWRDQRRYLVYVLLAVFLVVVAAFFSGRWWIGGLLGESWLQGASITLAVLPVTITLAFAQVMTPQWLGRGLFAQTSIVTAATALINTALNIWLIPIHGVWALVWSSWICLGLLTLCFQAWFFIYCNRRAANSA